MSDVCSPDSQDAFDRSDADDARIESLVRCAGHYIRPSDDLRPRVLDAAKEHCGDFHAERRLGSFALTMLVLVVVAFPAVDRFANHRASVSIQAATEVERHAAELASHPEFGSHWSLAEAFSQWRHLMATRFGHTDS